MMKKANVIFEVEILYDSEIIDPEDCLQIGWKNEKDEKIYDDCKYFCVDDIKVFAPTNGSSETSTKKKEIRKIEASVAFDPEVADINSDNIDVFAFDQNSGSIVSDLDGLQILSARRLDVKSIKKTAKQKPNTKEVQFDNLEKNIRLARIIFGMGFFIVFTLLCGGIFIIIAMFILDILKYSNKNPITMLIFVGICFCIGILVGRPLGLHILLKAELINEKEFEKLKALTRKRN